MVIAIPGVLSRGASHTAKATTERACTRDEESGKVGAEEDEHIPEKQPFAQRPQPADNQRSSRGALETHAKARINQKVGSALDW